MKAFRMIPGIHDLEVNRPLVESVYQKIIFLFLNQNTCCGYSNETVLLSTQNIFSN